jgi:hypothetical protein
MVDKVTGSWADVIALSYKIGYVLVVLGAMHFLNLYLRRTHIQARNTPVSERVSRTRISFFVLETSGN